MEVSYMKCKVTWVTRKGRRKTDSNNRTWAGLGGTVVSIAGFQKIEPGNTVFPYSSKMEIKNLFVPAIKIIVK